MKVLKARRRTSLELLTLLQAGTEFSNHTIAAMSHRNSKTSKVKNAVHTVQRQYIPLLKERFPYLIQHSISHDVTPLTVKGPGPCGKLCIAVTRDDPVDTALDWYSSLCNVAFHNKKIPIVNMAHERTPGGDWQAGQGFEEELCRRSNLNQVLQLPDVSFHYPLPSQRLIHSLSVCKWSHGSIALPS